MRHKTTARRMGYEDLPQLMTRMTGDEKHEPSATSTLDVLWVLYDRILRFDPADTEDDARDRFLLSKGHGPIAYYAVLAAKGLIPLEWLSSFGDYDSPLGWHPDSRLVPGVEISSGSLGHGLPIAVGVAAALRAKRSDSRVICLLGDGELDEGSNHEAIAVAGRMQLDQLQAVVIDNRSSSWGWPGGIERRFMQEGWLATVVDGRDHDALTKAFQQSHDRPRVVVAQVETKQ